MREDLAGRLELTHARARALLGPTENIKNFEQTESSEEGPRPPCEEDVQRIAARIRSQSRIQPERALILARELVEQARAALNKDELSETDARALESVIYVRGRPALRILNGRLESLDHFPGSELWQNFITDSEDRMIAAGSATGAITFEAFATGNPRLLQATAWMVAPNRVVTNRHALIPNHEDRLIDLGTTELDARVRDDYTLDIEFATDNRNPPVSISRRVKKLLYIAKESDPVDVAVLEIEPNLGAAPLVLAEPTAEVPKYLYVVGHPALTRDVPDDVKAVFGNPDGKKRVSFGQLLSMLDNEGTILHDASTIGGYSGGPVIGISANTVAALHYFGDPSAGNFAVAARSLHAHPVRRFLEAHQ